MCPGYAVGDALPEEVLTKVPPTLRERFAGGNEAVFAPLRADLPATWAALTTSMPGVELLHRRVSRFSMMGEQKVEHLVSR